MNKIDRVSVLQQVAPPLHEVLNSVQNFRVCFLLLSNSGCLRIPPPKTQQASLGPGA